MAPLKLEVFEANVGASPANTTAVDAAEIEEQRLEAFESGYKAGWDDAVAARSDAEAEQRNEVARALQALSFTFHDARAHVLHALSPLMAEVAARLLPVIAHAALPHLVVEALGPYAEVASEAPVLILLNPEARHRVETLIGTQSGLPVRFQETADLTPGQVNLRLGETETRVDLDAALATIRAALEDFFDLAAKENRHG
ncbi:MAG: flagellar biosynthesis protein [Gemmobacter sp.]|jgi:flagellar biosynthesis/type III secretory pathway protein FliH|nr:flagellar biosynthesis protein [Gemmobacter sp.]